jgi:enterochelin esterase-like enzyme
MLRRLLLLAISLAVIAGFVALALALAFARPDQHGARVLRFTIHSRYAHQTIHEVVVVPPGTTGRGRPLLVFLHGRGSDGQDQSLVSPMFAALADQGAAAPVVVFPGGGDSSYWHNRSTGEWASYVTKEVIPAAIKLVGADRRRIAIGGLSMGGFGSLDIARLHPGRFCAVGADSAAIWFRGADSAAGAFDDGEDFSRHDLLATAASANPYGSTPLWMDVGRSDPFRAADTALAHELRGDGARVTFHIYPGGHEDGYWSSHWRQYMRFYARALSRCRR